MLQTSADPQWSLTPYAGLQINSTAISSDGSQLITGTSAEYGTSDNFAIYSYTTNGSEPASPNWSDPLGAGVTQGVFWVAMSGDGTQCAAGGEYGSGKGFLRTYNVSQGTSSRQEFKTTGRINEVEINSNGNQIVAVENSNVHYLTLNSGTYTDAVTTVPASTAYVRSCGISDDGNWVVVGGEIFSSEQSTQANTPHGRRQLEAQSTTTGVFYVYQNVNGVLTLRGSYSSSSGILRVVITRDGEYAAASTKSGEVLYFNFVRNLSANLTPAWTYQATDYSIGMSYALAICHTNGMVYVGVGGNSATTSSVDSATPAFGYAYMLQSTFDRTTNQYYGNRLWIYQLQYCPNPGMNMDANAQYVTSADGEPIFSSSKSKSTSGTTSETPGNFYLFDVNKGTLYWQYPTSVMNWPMAINAAGTAIFAGSDNGNVYYWGAPSLNKIAIK